MLSLDEKAAAANSALTQRMLTLIIGRLVVIFLLLATSWFWASGTLRLSFDKFPQWLIPLFMVAVGLTIVYFFLLRLSSNYSWQVRIQFLLDIALITWLVWRTGDLTSPYISLYIVAIGVASFFIRPLPTLLLSGLAALCVVVLSILTHSGAIEAFGTVAPLDKAIQIVSFNVVALLVVGILAARLSERHASGYALEETVRSLEHLRALHERIVESIRSGLVTTDLDGNIYTFNAAATEITGYHLDQVQGRPLSEIFGNIQEQIDLSLEAAGEGEALPRFEADLLTPDGFVVRIGFSVSLLMSEKNEATGLIITFQDLTEIRSMEESIRRKDRLAAVGRVAAGLAHEIRNPLGAMRGAIQVLESSTAPGSTQAGLMDIILKESDRLNSIITNFLSYARPGAGDFADVDLAQALNDTVTLLKHSPDVRESHVLDKELSPANMVGDPTQLKQIFWNLARNALQAMPDGGNLHIGLKPLPNKRVRIIFGDSGRGMSQEQVERLFEPFSSSTSGGTGLGLSIVYQIVKDHNGVINVRSREGEGTTITIDFPRDNRRAVAKDNGRESVDATPIKDFLNVGEE
ncbi:MAG: PAS domain S-box protein [Acidobacteria bacterium]|nr:PAS domain S-box protein [Acidobacteriota bacterium]